MGQASGWFRDPSDRRLFLALLINFLLFGVSVTIVGATVPEIIRQFGWTYLAMGAVISAAPVGYFVSTFASGILVERFGMKMVLLSGLVLQVLGLSFFGTGPSILLNLSLTFLMGLGQGSTEVVTDFCVTRMDHPGRSRLLSLMHAAFPAGAVAGPLFLGYVISTGQAWQAFYRALAITGILITIGLATLRFPSGREGRKRLGFEVFRDRFLILLSIVMFLFIGAELGISAWLSEYFVRVFGSSSSTGAWMVSLFWLGALSGRLSLSILYRGSEQANILVVLGCSVVIILSLFPLMASPFWAGILILLLGLGFSVIFPFVIVIAGYGFRENQGVAIGTVATGGGVGGFVFPVIMGSIIGQYEIQWGFLFCIGATIIGTGIILLMRRTSPDIESGERLETDTP
jgi:fucose permease